MQGTQATTPMNLQVPTDLKSAFMKVVNEEQRPASRVILELMEDYVSRAQERKKSMCDDWLSHAKAGQPAILEATLKAGVSLTFRDDKGDFMQKKPDGTTVLLHKNER